MKIVILAGGKGSRMGALSAGIPKPMLALAGKPILEHQVELARRYDLTDIHILTGYRGDVIAAHFGNGHRWGVEIRYTQEDEALGTAGAVRGIAGELRDDFLVFYGDVMMDVDLAALTRAHEQARPDATIVVHPNDHPYDSDLVEVGSDGRIAAIHAKPHQPGSLHRNLVSAALYVLSPRILDSVPRGAFSDFGRNVFPALAARGADLRAYSTREYIKDIGTVTRLHEVEADVRSGRVARFNGSSPLGAVFIDRDGVLNPDITPVLTLEDMVTFPGVPGAIRELNRSERLSVVVTNQPLVAKGMVSEGDLERIHAKLEAALSEEGAYVDGIYYCPHHPERGHPGERAEYKIECDCRKPRIGMIRRAAGDLHIDLSDSFIIGDRTVDVVTGRNAGLATVLVRTGCGGTDGLHAADADFICDDLADAVRFLSDDYPGLFERAVRMVDPLLDSPADRRVVLVGGMSRSGKSTFAAVLARAFASRGITARHLRLDHWIVPESARPKAATVRDRFRYSDITMAVRRLLQGERIEFDRYDPMRRGAEGRTDSLELGEREFLIVDGVPALDIGELRDVSALRIYVEAAGDVREKRFHSFYSEKGLPVADIQALRAKRQADEEPFVLESAAHAHTRIDLEAIK